MSSHRRRIGLLGGSFNPPHVCHLLSSLYLLETTDLDAVWWLPVHRHAFAKDSTLASFEDRLALCQAATAGFERIALDPIEAELPPPSRTIDTVAALRARHPDIGFSWIVGADILDELPRWHRWSELREQVRFVVVGRGDHDFGLPPGGQFVVRPFRLPPVSSSAVRAAVAAGEPIDHLVSRAVSATIRARGLYR